MNAAAPGAGRLGAAWAALGGHIDALPDRDRHLLLVGALAVLVAADLMLVQPLGAKRKAVVAAAAEQIASTQAEHDRVAQELAQSRHQLDAQARRLDAELQRLGAERPDGEPLARLLRRVLARQGVAVVSLRDLDVVEVEAGGSATAASTPEGAEHTRLLFKHRLELTLDGQAAALVAAVAALDQHARPLRIERVRLVAQAGPATTQQAVITLAVLGTDRTWLAI